MSGGLLVNALLRETGHEITSTDADHMQKWHAEAYAKPVSQVCPLPGAVELLSLLTKANAPYAVREALVAQQSKQVVSLISLET